MESNKQALSEQMYESPRVEVLEVSVEKGFAGSDVSSANTYPGWNTDSEEWY